MAGWHVAELPGRGRCVIADRAFSPGDLVLEDQPYAWELYDEQLPQRCACCLGAPTGGGGGLLRCSRCAACCYLSRDHQRRHWAAGGHREECALLAAARPRLPPASVRLAARCALRRHREHPRQQQGGRGSHEQDASAGPLAWSGYEAVEALVHHWEALPEGQRLRLAQAGALAWQLLRTASEGAAELTSPRQLALLLARFASNNHTICDDELRPLGLGVYPAAAMANHSCQPSCVQSFDGPRILFRAVRPMAPGDEVTIAYVELAAPRWERRAALLEQYHFDLDAGAAVGTAAGPAGPAGPSGASSAGTTGAAAPTSVMALPGGRRLALHVTPAALPPWLHDGRDAELSAAGTPGAGGAFRAVGGMWGELRAAEPHADGAPASQSFDIDDADGAGAPAGGGTGPASLPEAPPAPPVAELHWWGAAPLRSAEERSVLGLAGTYREALLLLQRCEGLGPGAAGAGPARLLASLQAVLQALGGGGASSGGGGQGLALGPLHILRTRLLAAALRAGIAAGDWAAALRAARPLAGHYDVLYPEVWPARGLHWAQLAKLEALEGTPLRALRAAQRAEAALGGSSARGPAAEEVRRVAAEAAAELQRRQGLKSTGGEREGSPSDEGL